MRPVGGFRKLSVLEVKEKDEAAPGPGKPLGALGGSTGGWRYGAPSCDVKYRRTRGRSLDGAELKSWPVCTGNP